MFTAEERIERNGFLVAYAGETMTDAEAARRGLIDSAAAEESADVIRVGTPAAEEQTAIVEPPIDEEWANAAGMSLEECIALWNEDPHAVLEAIKENLAEQEQVANDSEENSTADNGGNAENTDNAASGNEGSTAGDNSENPDDSGKPSHKELREECEKRGIKAPKNATIAQLQALLED